MMKWTNLDPLEDSEADIDLLRCPVNQIGLLLDLVQFDRFLDYVYAVLLKRVPDLEGKTHYRELACKGLTRATIVKRIMRSREYMSSSVEEAGLKLDEFVNRAYQDVLGRWPDQEGLATYRRIAARPNGRRKALANLRASGEALRKGGGRLAKIEVLRRYARAGWPARLPGVGPWFAARRELRLRLDRMALSHRLLARQVASLREELAAASTAGAEPFGFLPEPSASGEAIDGEKAAAIFHHTLTRARRDA